METRKPRKNTMRSKEEMMSREKRMISSSMMYVVLARMEHTSMQ